MKRFIFQKSLLSKLSFLPEATIEKARKGEVRPHKYIYRRETGKSERPYEYIWLDDLLKNPLKQIKDVFNFSESNIDKMFSKVTEKYGANKKEFEQHLLEYFCHRNIWDKRFSNSDKAKKFETPIKMTDCKILPEDMQAPAAVDTQLSLFEEPEKTNKDFTPNPSLMRYIWSNFGGKNVISNENNIVAENKIQETVVQKENSEVKTIEESKAEKHENRSNAMLGNQNAKKGYSPETIEKNKEWIKDLQEDNDRITAENKTRLKEFNDFLNNSNAAKWIRDHAKKEPVNTLVRKEQIEIGVAVPNFEISHEGFNGKIPYNMATKFEKELKKKAAFSYKDENGNLVSESFYLTKPKYKGDPYKASYQKQIFSTDLSIDIAQKIVNGEDFEMPTESDFEKYLNRSEAMKGNQNAKKYGLTDEEYAKLTKIIDDDKINGYSDLGTLSTLRYELKHIVSQKKYKEITNGIGKAEFVKQIYNDYVGENANGTDNTDIKSRGISGSDRDLRTAGRQDSNQTVSTTESTDNRDKFVQRTNELGIGLTESEITAGTGDGRGAITKTQAIKIRAACREILQKPENEITEADKAVLSQYVGAGGSGDDESSNSAKLYEYYTPQNVINKVWELVDKYMPNQNKRVIEPSSGIGRFANGRNEKFTLFEFEPESSKIAKILHPDAEVVEGAFERNFMKKYAGRFTKKHDKYNCAVGNPPYGAFAGRYKGEGEGKGHSQYDEYFVDRTLDTLEDGGILAFVMPSRFLNDPMNDGKRMIAEKGELLEAWRLPSGTFEQDVKGATEVGTDIVIIRKNKGGDPSKFERGNYFKDNPSHVCGEYAYKKNQWGDQVKYVQMDANGIDAALNKIDVNEVKPVAVQTSTQIENKPKVDIEITSNYVYGDTIKTQYGEGKIIGLLKNNNVKVGYWVRIDGTDYKVYLTNQPDTSKTEAEKRENRRRGMLGNKNAAGKHEMSFVPSTGVNMTAEEFNAKYGKDIDSKDAEIWQATDYDGNINISKLTDEQLKYINNSDHFVKDNGEYVNIVNYASGNIREKLNDLQNSYESKQITQEDYEFKKSLLETALPETKEISQIRISPIAKWTLNYKLKDGSDLITAFYDWANNGLPEHDDMNSPIPPTEIPPEISWEDIDNYIRRRSVSGVASKKDDKKKLAYKIRNVRREAAEKIFNRFLQEGLPQDEQKRLTETWNENFNSYVNPDYRKIPLFISGMNTKKGTKDFNLTAKQIKGISFLTNKGSGLLAYDVGVGKTVTGLCATVNQMQSGRCKNPLIVVPKAVYKKWIGEIHQHFPDLKINELGNLGKEYYTPGWKPEPNTLTIVTETALEKLSFHDETMTELQKDVEFAQLQTTTKKVNKRQAAAKGQKIDELVGSMTKTGDNEAIYFEDLGFDHITVDEIHRFKNIFTAPRKIETKDSDKNESNEFGNIGGATSDRGQKLYAICQYIQGHNGEKNVFGLSATPFQNSAIEIYNILSLFARRKMRDMGIGTLEEFVKQFAQLKSEYVVKADRIEESLVMKDFNNLTALQNLITEYIDKVDGDEAHVVRPRKVTHTPEIEMTDLQKQIMQAESEYMSFQATLPKDERDEGATLVSMNAMRSATLSPALVDESRFEIYRKMGYDIKKPAYSEVVTSSPKLKFVCDSIIEQYKNNSSNGQVMYMPQGVKQFGEVKKYLIDNGIPEDVITTIDSQASGEKALNAIEEKIDEFNNSEGKCKVIIGSGTIKEGVSLNGNSTTIYNCQLGWNPTETTQVEGRIWRQGNKQGKVHVVYPLMYDTIDSMMYQKYEEKSGRINQLFSYKGDSLNVEDINPEELKYELIKDPAKRAKLMVDEEMDQAAADERLYGQMIDILHKQRYSAFTAVESQPEYIAQVDTVNKQQKLIEGMERNYKTFKTNIEEQKAKIGNAPDIKSQSDMIEKLAKQEEYLEQMQVKIDSCKRIRDKAKRNMKKIEESQQTVINALKRKGLKNSDDIQKKINSLVTLMDKAKTRQTEAKQLYNEFYTKAVIDNENKKKSIPTLQELVKKEVNSIVSDLVPMDQIRDDIKAELEIKYPTVKKSFPIMYVKNGKIYLKKIITL